MQKDSSEGRPSEDVYFRFYIDALPPYIHFKQKDKNVTTLVATFTIAQSIEDKLIEPKKIVGPILKEDKNTKLSLPLLLNTLLQCGN